RLSFDLDGLAEFGPGERDFRPAEGQCFAGDVVAVRFDRLLKLGRFGGEMEDDAILDLQVGFLAGFLDVANDLAGEAFEGEGFGDADVEEDLGAAIDYAGPAFGGALGDDEVGRVEGERIAVAGQVEGLAGLNEFDELGRRGGGDGGQGVLEAGAE